jgi:diamine N-acetyltransferase
MEKVSFVLVGGEADVQTAAKLANQIWREYYTPMIGKAQVEYMLANLQSADAIARQIKEGCLYYLVRDNEGKNIGYFAAFPRKEEMFLSKLYITAETRGQGYGRQSMEFISGLARERGLPMIALTVHKGNAKAIERYKKHGFVIKEPVVIDIGGGFVMDDYRMELKLK